MAELIKISPRTLGNLRPSVLQALKAQLVDYNQRQIAMAVVEKTLSAMETDDLEALEEVFTIAVKLRSIWPRAISHHKAVRVNVTSAQPALWLAFLSGFSGQSFAYVMKWASNAKRIMEIAAKSDIPGNVDELNDAQLVTVVDGLRKSLSTLLH
jgi:hypothetical protein